WQCDFNIPTRSPERAAKPGKKMPPGGNPSLGGIFMQRSGHDAFTCEGQRHIAASSKTLYGTGPRSMSDVAICRQLWEGGIPAGVLTGHSKARPPNPTP